MNPALTNAPTTDPGSILRYRDSQYAADLLATLILHFDFFTWLDRHAGVGTEAIRAHFGFAPRPADVLLTLCRANQFIRSEGEAGHWLTPVAREHLVQGSPWYLGPYYEPLRESAVVQAFLKVLRTGRPANWQARAEGADWHRSMLSEEFARGFTALMNCRGLALGQALAGALGPMLEGRSRLLDVGGGSGIYAATMVAGHPRLTAAVMEQAPVDRIAREAMVSHGLAGRVEVVTGDMFETPWPGGCDVHLLSNVLHDWDVPEVRMLLERSAAALPRGGLLVIHEAFVDDAKTGPLTVAEYSALLMNITQGKCYAPHEYAVLLRESGFEPGPYRDTIAHRGFMTAVRR